jgi:hypothetical protein
MTGLDLLDIENASDAMKSWLKEKGGGDLISELEPYMPSSNIKIFGVSSGSLDKEAQSEPVRLLDPYLWLLHRNRVIK